MLCKTLYLLIILQLAIYPTLFSQTNEQFRANLYGFEADGKAYLDDGNLTMYNPGNSNAIDGMDAVKLSNFGENFGLQRGPTTLVIERRKSIIASDTTFFKMWNMRQKTYKIELQLTGLDHPGLQAVLEDLYLNTKTNLTLNGITSSAFTITGVAASAAPDRFRVIFFSPSFSPLPITFTNFKAYEKNGNINVQWQVENDKSIYQYQIQKSLNGQQFITAGTIELKDYNTAIYKWTDNSSVTGSNFYRIKSVAISGKAEYSSVIKVLTGASGTPVKVYPNPVVDGIINLQLLNQPKGIYTVRLINNFGQVLNVIPIKHDGGSSTQTIQVNKNIEKGIYQLEVIKPGNSKTIIKILVE